MLWMTGIERMVRRRPSRPLFQGRGCRLGDADAVLERCGGEHVGDELVAVEAPPAFLGGVEQLVGDRERGLLGAGALSDAGAQLDGREAGLDRVRRAQVAPVLSGKS